MKKIDVVFDVWSHNEGVPIRKDLEACLRAIGVDPEEEMPAPAKPEADVGFVQPPAPHAAGEEYMWVHDFWWSTFGKTEDTLDGALRSLAAESARRERETWAKEKAKLEASVRIWKRIQETTEQEVTDLRADRDRLETETKRQRGLLLWLLWHHQGGNSDVGQPIRSVLGIGRYARMTSDQVEAAKAAAPAWTLSKELSARVPR